MQRSTPRHLSRNDAADASPQDGPADFSSRHYAVFFAEDVSASDTYVQWFKEFANEDPAKGFFFLEPDGFRDFCKLRSLRFADSADVSSKINTSSTVCSPRSTDGAYTSS